MKTVKIGNHTFRLPYVDMFPFDDKEADDVRESIREVGISIPVLCWQEKKKADEDTVIDGAHRVLFAAELGMKKVPRMHRSFESEEKAREECERINIDRRPVAASVVKERRRARIERVAARRQDGASQRVIAGEEGISQPQVASDLQAATDKGLSVEPPDGKVTGKDGRVTTPPIKPKILCDRCKRLGETKGCEGCKEARAAKKAEKPPPPDTIGDANETDEWPVDALGEKVPEQSREAFASVPTFSDLCRKIDGIVAAIKELGKGAAGRLMHLDSYTQSLQSVRRQLWVSRPTHVCPYCHGNRSNCTCCKGQGWTDKSTYEAAPKEAAPK